MRARAEAASAGAANERSEDNFCSMKITQEVREFAAKQNQESDAFLAAEEAEAGMAENERAAPRGWWRTLREPLNLPRGWHPLDRRRVRTIR